MFGVVSKKKYISALDKINVLETFIKKQEEKLQMIEDSDIELNNCIREMHKKYGDIITKLGSKEEALTEENKGLKQKNMVTKVAIFKEVRKRLLQEIIEFKKSIAKEKFKRIDSSGYVKAVNTLDEKIRAFEIIRFSLIESIAEDFIKIMDKHLEEVGDGLFE